MHSDDERAALLLWVGANAELDAAKRAKASDSDFNMMIVYCFIVL